jgi:hypothetical protein
MVRLERKEDGGRGRRRAKREMRVGGIDTVKCGIMGRKRAKN